MNSFRTSSFYAIVDAMAIVSTPTMIPVSASPTKATRRLMILLVMIMGVAMILPSNLAFASPDGGSDEGTESGPTTEDDGYTYPEEEKDQM